MKNRQAFRTIDTNVQTGDINIDRVKITFSNQGRTLKINLNFNNAPRALQHQKAILADLLSGQGKYDLPKVFKLDRVIITLSQEVNKDALLQNVKKLNKPDYLTNLTT